jgi:hypothetical protein
MSFGRRMATLAALFGMMAGAGSVATGRQDNSNSLLPQQTRGFNKSRVTLPPGTNPKAATRRISFRPLGWPLTMRVRKGLKWGHRAKFRGADARILAIDESQNLVHRAA